MSRDLFTITGMVDEIFYAAKRMKEELDRPSNANEIDYDSIENAAYELASTTESLGQEIEDGEEEEE